MQNLKDKLINKISTSVPSANSFQNSNLNPFNYFNSPSISNLNANTSSGGSSTRNHSLKLSPNNQSRFNEEGNNFL